MRPLALPLAVLLTAAAPAFAQDKPADIAYCQKLADTYVRYIGRSESSPIDQIHRGSNDAQVASVQCQPGTAASATQVLSRVLVANGFTLPQR